MMLDSSSTEHVLGWDWRTEAGQLAGDSSILIDRPANHSTAMTGCNDCAFPWSGVLGWTPSCL